MSGWQIGEQPICTHTNCGFSVSDSDLVHLPIVSEEHLIYSGIQLASLGHDNSPNNRAIGWLVSKS